MLPIYYGNEVTGSIITQYEVLRGILQKKTHSFFRYRVDSTGEWLPCETRTFVYDDWNPILETIVNHVTGTTNTVRYLWGLDLSGGDQTLSAPRRENSGRTLPFFQALCGRDRSRKRRAR